MDLLFACFLLFTGQSMNEIFLDRMISEDGLPPLSTSSIFMTLSEVLFTISSSDSYVDAIKDYHDQ